MHLYTIPFSTVCQVGLLAYAFVQTRATRNQAAPQNPDSMAYFIGNSEKRNMSDDLFHAIVDVMNNL